jgi:hypothetical protein
MTQASCSHIAQLNVGRAVAPLDDAVMADFMNWHDEINARAERSPVCIWRLQGDNGNNTSLKVTDPLFIVNLTVWSSIEALYDYTYRSDHNAEGARDIDRPDGWRLSFAAHCRSSSDLPSPSRISPPTFGSTGA